MTFERTTQQRMEALHKANETRTQRAKLKDDLKSGRTEARDVIARPPTFATNMKVGDLLLAIPHYGRVKVNKLLGQCHVAASKNLGGLTQRQRRELARELGRARLHTSGVYTPPMTASAFNSSVSVQGVGSERRS